MKTYLSLLMIASLLLLGCTGGGGSTGPVAGGAGQVIDNVVQQGSPAEECESSYSFSELAPATLSGSSKLTATVTCAAGKDIVLLVDGAERETKSAPGNATTPVEFQVVAQKDGTSSLEVKIDNEPAFSRQWEVAPLGNSKVSKADFDPFTFKRYIAYGFSAQNPFKLGHIKAYMKRLEDKTQVNTNIVVEVRKDASGKPGALVASSTRPITDTTLSDNWIKFSFATTPQLSAGKYWLAFKIDQSENIQLVSDAVMPHYVIADKDSSNDYTLGMDLAVDQKTGYASETTWQSLAYSKDYSVTIHAAE